MRNLSFSSLAYILLATLFSLVPPKNANANGLTVEQMTGLSWVGGASLSPDGGKAAYIIYPNEGDPVLRVIDVDTRSDRVLIDGLSGLANTSWSNDGKSVFFTASDQDGVSQLFKLDSDGSRKKQITYSSLNIEGYRHAGNDLYVWVSVFLDCDPLISCTTDRILAASSGSSAKIYDSLFVRHWNRWEDGRVRVLFGVDDAGTMFPLTDHLEVDVPSAPWGSSSDLVITEDGDIFASVRPKGSEIAWNMNGDIHLIPAGQRSSINLTIHNLAMDVAPRISPDGKTLYYLATSKPGHEADRYVLRSMDLETRNVTDLSDGFDVPIWSFNLIGNGDVLIKGTRSGVAGLFLLDAMTGKIEQLTHTGNVRSFDMKNNRILATIDSFKEPGDLWLLDLFGQKTRLTNVNADVMKDVELSDPMRFSFKGWNDEQVEGVVFHPVGYEEGRKYPTLLVIHGGPQSSFWDRWDGRYQPQIFAAAGFAVVAIDFHGSVGYGQDFTDSISNDWGGKPLVDQKKGLAAAGAQFEYIDVENSCAFGWSYGGYMVKWIASQWGEGFKCLVSHAGVFDTRLGYYSTEELWFNEWELGGPYFEAPTTHEHQNPVHHVKSWDTPMLITHGLKDFRVVSDHSIGAFNALQRQGIESRLIVFPDEDHAVYDDANRVVWYNAVIDWIHHYTSP